jgi:photosystem II stability/assembly factor-like uncharacterized protein|tara:strand:+ start:1753 stop:4932 length:3180 start_codon:yes stop_codon:yes gene_type:complete
MKRNILFILVLISAILSADGLDMKKFKGMKARSIGPSGMSGRVTAIDVVLSNTDVIYVGTASGGLWKSESGGIKWEPIFDDQKAASIGDVTVDPTNPDVIWVGTGEGNPRNSQSAGFGVYKSIDGGKSWDFKGLGETRNIHRVLINPHNPDEVYVGAQGPAWGETEHRGVYKTTNGGDSWEKILYIDKKTGIGELVLDPRNPDKLIANMWQFRRWPWFFKSGGPSSGMHITFDGGKTWKKRTDKDGLPKGDLGRMGIAIAPSNPKLIYALIESKKNALYKSEDGGFKWEKVSDKNIGGRPFYYAEIYVDPVNENRIYNLHTYVTVSNDGGKTFGSLMTAYGANGVHPDHHAFWGHPTNPNFIIEGNDGGLNFSMDRGKTWRFVENLPLAQFYHINYDMDWPYNVYGGMQDNGSWRGPAYIWRSGGIRNSYWDELAFGDGFDVVPHPGNSRFGYAMSQQGNVSRYDLITGHQQMIRPVHPNGEYLRFNWNAAIAQDPFDENAIFFGSQYVHYSTDRGNNWDIISPDLTTNDPEKQKQHESGGLTFDATGAENYTTILAIEPSSLDRNVIWVGTDDGNVQLTTDRGKTWNNLAKKIHGAPVGSWVTQINASKYDPAEAVIVINNYRRNDWKPYVFKTNNYGKSWKSIANEEDLWGHALSFVQDPIEPNLQFLGTEYGLYVTLDNAKTWTKWTSGYPTVSTMDLKIHPREHDLVIGTFGRAAYILDDIRPLREMASTKKDLMKKRLHFFEPPTAVMAINRQASGTRFEANAIFAGKNRGRGAMLTLVFNPDKKKKDKPKKDKEDKKEKPGSKKEKITMEVLDEDGNVIRTVKHNVEAGINRVYWGLRRKGVRSPNAPKPTKPDAKEPGGPPVLPGEYTIRLSHGKDTTSQVVNVILDPRVGINTRNLERLQPIYERQMEITASVTKAMDRIRESKKIVESVNKMLDVKKNKSHKTLQNNGKSMTDSLKVLEELIVNKKGLQGIVRSPKILSGKIRALNRYLYSNLTGPNKSHDYLLDYSEAETEKVLDQVNQFYKEEWPKYQTAVENENLSLFKEFTLIKID